MLGVADCIAGCVWLAVPQPNKWQYIGHYCSSLGFNAEGLRNDEYLIGPRIFCFAAGWVTAYVDVPPLRIEGANDVSGLARHRLSSWERRFGRGRIRGAWFYSKRR